MNMKCHKLSPTAFSPMGGGYAHTRKRNNYAHFRRIFAAGGLCPHKKKKQLYVYNFLKI